MRGSVLMNNTERAFSSIFVAVPEPHAASAAWNNEIGPRSDRLVPHPVARVRVTIGPRRHPRPKNWFMVSRLVSS